MKNNPITLRLKKLHVGATIPKYATPGAACFDITACIDAGVVVIGPRQRAQIKSGIAVEVPTGHVMLLYSRSGHGAKHGVRLGNCVGVIDSDYRGEVMLILTNDSDNDFEVHHGERFAQGMIVPLPDVSIEAVDELSDTARGAGGLGSTGT